MVKAILFEMRTEPLPGLCPVVLCPRPRARRNPLCCCHAMRKWRAAHPIAAHYARLKAKAKRRGIAFTLTPEDWQQFCEATGYVESVGCGEPTDLQCDRVDARRGYARDNIQALAFIDNVRKGNAERHFVVVDEPF